MLDPRQVSGAAFLLVGVIVCGFVIRVWITHPVNRVFLVGDYITGKGLRFLLNNLPTVFALGLAAISAGIAKFAYAARWTGDSMGSAADFFGTIEAIFTVWAAGCVCIAAWRLCRKG